MADRYQPFGGIYSFHLQDSTALKMEIARFPMQCYLSSYIVSHITRKPLHTHQGENLETHLKS